MNTQTSWQFSPDEFLWVWAAETEVQIILWGRYPRSATRLRTLAAAVGDLGVVLF
ncbi:hypothetical protein [Nocardia terpenica]|uniref:hypothetical protein n=1 Tax=Nocardia terpenica TaxID=455432 RepID=UPI0002F80C98|nr:hypothetical protein [Nocardia terpenica]NQE86505.1 hypothetical protein [Nocardia terpenica]